MAGELIVEDRGATRLITLKNPARRNALDLQMLERLAEALAPAAGVRVLRLEGDQAHFCSGFDLAQLPKVNPGDPLPDQPVGRVLALLEAYPAPSVAVIRGGAFGAGCDLASACDFRIGDPSAVFCMPPARLGVVYAPEGIARFTALVGPARAKRMFFTARKIDASTALGWGLLDELHPAPGLEAAAAAFCEELAEGSPLAVSGMKRVFGVLGGAALTSAERAELDGLRRRAFESEDVREGRAAFLEKRAPRFTGR